MNSRPALQLEVAGQIRNFEYETTEVHLYRSVVDVVYNHVQVEEYGTQRVFLFNVPNLLCYLSGAEVPGHNLGKKELRKVTSEMDEKLGWEATTIIRDECPQDIKDRYMRIATKALQGTVYVPSGW